MTAITDQSAPISDRLESRTEREYRKALRHSQTVRRLKIALPAAAAVMIGGFFAVSMLGSQLPDGVSVSSTVLEDGKLVMYKPTLTGENQNNQPYELRAERAVQDLTTPDLIELQDISADLPVSPELKASLKAVSGIYDKNLQTVKFDKPFKVTTDSGMTADLESADIDIQAGKLTSDKPVKIRLPEGAVDANTMRMTDRGNTIILENQVRMTINPSALRKGGNQSAGNAPQTSGTEN